MSEKRRYSLFPKPLAGCIEPLTRPVLRAHAGAAARLITHWPNIVGDKLASRCYPENISRKSSKTSGSTLTIAVQNGYATEIQFMSAVILERIHGFLGALSIDRIVISQSYVAPTQKPARTNNRKPVKLNYEATVQDAELDQALASLARTLASPLP